MPASTPIPLGTDSAEALRDLVKSLLKMHRHDLPPSVSVELHMHMPDRRDLYDALVPPSAPQNLFPDHALPFRSCHISDGAEWPSRPTKFVLYSSTTPEEVKEAAQLQEAAQEAQRNA